MWMKRKLIPTDRNHEEFKGEKIRSKELKRIKLSSSNRVIENGSRNNKRTDSQDSDSD